MLHPFVRWLSRRCLGWFYREVHFVGREHLPASAPMMLMLNHPNDLPDVLIGYLACPRDVRYVATISAAESWIASWTYRGLGVIPITRIRDARRLKELGTDAAALNADAFARIRGALEAGEVVGIFPEGGVTNLPYLAPFKQGMARVALESRDTASIVGVKIVPIGIQYENPSGLRSDVIAVVGEPLDLDSWLPTGTVNVRQQLTGELFVRLSAVTKNAATDVDWLVFTRAIAALGAIEANDHEPSLMAAERVRALLDKTRGVPANADDNSTVGELQQMQQEIEKLAGLVAEQVDRAGGSGNSARDHSRVLFSAGDRDVHALLPNSARLAVMAPLAVLAWSIHAIPFAAVLAMARRVAEDKSEVAARAINPGLFVIFGWYAALAIALVAVGAWRWLWLIVLLPKLGDIAVAWRDDVVAWRMCWRVRRWPAHDRTALVEHSQALRERWRIFRATLADIRGTSLSNSSVVYRSTVSNSSSHKMQTVKSNGSHNASTGVVHGSGVAE